MRTDTVWTAIAREESRDLLVQLRKEQSIEFWVATAILVIAGYFHWGDATMIFFAFAATVGIICRQIQIVAARLDAGRAWVEQAMAAIPVGADCRFPTNNGYQTHPPA